MLNGLLAPKIIKGTFQFFLWLLIWVEVDLLSRLMLGVNLSPAHVPLGFLHGIGRLVPFGTIVALIFWLLQLMLISAALRGFGLVRWTPYNRREASWMFGEANGVRSAGPNWDLPGEELVSVEQTEHELVFELGAGNEIMNSRDKIVLEGLIKLFVSPSHVQIVSAWGGMRTLLSGKLRSLAIDVIDAAIQSEDYEDIMDLAGSGRFANQLRNEMNKVLPTQEERDQLAEFPGMEITARRARTALELYGVRLLRVNAHLDENTSISEAARKGKEAEEMVGVAKFTAEAEKKRAIGDRAAAATRAGLTLKEFSALPMDQRLELLRIGGGNSTSTTEHKTFGLTPDTTDALTTGVAGMLAGIADARRHADDSKDDS